MKAHCYIFSVLIPLIFIGSLYPQAKNNKHCLIVAIGEYKYLRPISAVNDIPLIQSALEVQGFTDFRILKNEQATRNNILKELRKLEDDTQPGDIIVIHFSSHGQGIPDDNGDEPDGIDESICCYGAESYLTDTYKGEEHLRDDQLGEYLDRIRLKAGKTGQVLVLLDACYSGSGTRGDDKISRGISHLLTKEGVTPSETKIDGVAFKETETTDKSNESAPLIVFSGSRADEKNFEYNSSGSLSYSFNKALTNNIGRKISYRALFADINSTMSTIARFQNPVAEGNGLDFQVFNAELCTAPDYFMISEYDNINKEVKLNGGSIAGFNTNSKVAFYPAGTFDTTGKTPIFTGVVTTSTPLNSIAKCDKMSNDFEPQKYWCFLISSTLPTNNISVKISNDLQKSLRSRLVEEIGKFKLLDITDDSLKCDLKVKKGKKDDQFQIILSDVGSVICESSSDILELKSAVKQFTRARMFESINLNNPDIQISIELVPVKFDKKTKKITDTLKIENFYENGVLTVSGNDYFLLKIKNTGILKAYFNIINIEENAAVNLFIPYMKLNENPANYFIDAGREFVIPNFLYRFTNKTDFAFTSEIIKIIGSESPIDLRYAFMKDRGTDPVTKKGEPSILEDIIKMDDDLMNRAGITAPADELITTFTVTIRKSK
jgi:hypothetical protein